MPTADLLTNHRELTAAPLNLEKALYIERLYIFCSLAERLLGVVPRLSFKPFHIAISEVSQFRPKPLNDMISAI